MTLEEWLDKSLMIENFENKKPNRSHRSCSCKGTIRGLLGSSNPTQRCPTPTRV